MDLGLSGKRVLVTGGTRGAGRATVLAFAHSGAHVVTCHHTESEAAQTLAKELEDIGLPHAVVRADVTSPEGVRTLAAVCEDTLGGLDVVVNNVGIDGPVTFEEATIEDWNSVVTTNITSMYLVTQAALPLLVDGGSIVNVGASVALRGRSAGVHYTASKAAVIGLTRSLTKELGPRGIRVNVVAPGLIESEPGAGLPPEVVERIVGMTSLKRICMPEDVAGAVLFLAGDTSRYVTGATLNVDGGV